MNSLQPENHEGLDRFKVLFTAHVQSRLETGGVEILDALTLETVGLFLPKKTRSEYLRNYLELIQLERYAFFYELLSIFGLPASYSVARVAAEVDKKIFPADR